MFKGFVVLRGSGVVSPESRSTFASVGSQPFVPPSVGRLSCKMVAARAFCTATDRTAHQRAAQPRAAAACSCKGAERALVVAQSRIVSRQLWLHRPPVSQASVSNNNWSDPTSSG